MIQIHCNREQLGYYNYEKGYVIGPHFALPYQRILFHAYSAGKPEKLRVGRRLTRQNRIRLSLARAKKKKERKKALRPSQYREAFFLLRSCLRRRFSREKKRKVRLHSTERTLDSGWGEPSSRETVNRKRNWQGKKLMTQTLLFTVSHFFSFTSGTLIKNLQPSCPRRPSFLRRIQCRKRTLTKETSHPFLLLGTSRFLFDGMVSFCRIIFVVGNTEGRKAFSNFDFCRPRSACTASHDEKEPTHT